MRDPKLIHELKNYTAEELYSVMLRFRGLNKRSKLKIILSCLEDVQNNTQTRFNVINELAESLELFIKSKESK